MPPMLQLVPLVFARDGCDDESVRNADFYGLAAQVLPTLLIAVVLELRFLVPTVAKVGDYAVRLPIWEIIGSSAVITYVVVALSFVLGEVTALLVVFSGTGGWLPLLAGPATLVALCMLILVAVVAPFATMWTVVVGDELRRVGSQN